VSYKKRMVFHAHATQTLTGNKLFVSVVLVFCLTPIYPLYLRARRHSRSALAPLALIGAMICVFISVAASYVFHVTAPWVTLVSDLRSVLIVLACILFIWNGFARKSKIG
jgi:hypothetical protein